MSRHTPRTHAALLLTLLALALSSCSTAPPRPAAPAAPEVSIQQWITRAYVALANGDQASAASDFDHVIQNPAFAGLASDQRYMLLLDASRAQMPAGDARKAHALAVRASGYPMADGRTWLMRYFTAMQIHDVADQARSLTRIARHWPSNLHFVFPGAPLQLHRQLQREHREKLDGDLLDALFDARWPRHVDGADYLWRDLVLIHLRQDQLDRATQVALDIVKPSLVLSMRVDKRFDPIQRLHPGAFNLKRLVADRIRTVRAQAKAHPDQLALIQELQNLYLASGRPRRALAISHPVLASVKRDQGAMKYVDFSQKYNWILDNRARAYAHMGRWKQATRTMEAAARQGEFGNRNVSQVINLAGYYANLDQPGKAALALTGLGRNMSPYGRLQLERVRLYIAYDRKDADAMEVHMAYLRAHRALSIGAWQDALLLTGHVDEAAAVMIERLRNPDWRSDALLDMQDYPALPRTYIARRIDANWERMAKRKDVLAAVRKVGRIEQVHLTL